MQFKITDLPLRAIKFDCWRAGIVLLISKSTFSGVILAKYLNCTGHRTSKMDAKDFINKFYRCCCWAYGLTLNRFPRWRYGKSWRALKGNLHSYDKLTLNCWKGLLDSKIYSKTWKYLLSVQKLGLINVYFHF